MANVRLVVRGVLHIENGQLVIGDLLIDKAIIAKWGGNRQYGLFEAQFTLEPVESIDASPDMNGMLAERSEP